MKLIFSHPSLNDLIRLLKAWRFWSLGALIGALIGAAVYSVSPPPYRARATVVVDFNLEQAWPQETDREQFYYLTRETRKLREAAWSDDVMQAIAGEDGDVTINELRDEKLSLSQPADGGWHFYAQDHDPRRASLMASAWAQSFVEQVRAQVANTDGLNSFIEVNLTQSAQLPVERSMSISVYLFVGAVAFLALASFFVLFAGKPK